MRSGVIFDLKEFAVHDGPGIRVTVFLKGCALRCGWCHNPEGLLPQPQVLRGAAGERLAGETITSRDLAARLNRQAGLLRDGEGGVTFSGGEPLFQAAFVAEVIDQLDDLHVVLDTSGYGSEADFRLVAERADLVYYDLKLADPGAHRRHTGVDNAAILDNLRLLGGLGPPFVIRVPLVPGVTDSRDNLSGIARLVSGMPQLRRIDLLSYNRAAGAKYAACGLVFQPAFDEAIPVQVNLGWLEASGVEVRIL